MNNKMEICLKMTRHFEQAMKKDKKMTEQQYKQWNEEQAKELGSILKKRLCDASEDHGDIRECLLLCYNLSKQSIFHGPISQSLDSPFLAALSKYFSSTKPEYLMQGIRFVERMFLDKGYLLYSQSEELFTSIVTRFGELASNKMREITSEVLVEMMMDNKKLIKLCSKPYYFLEFWIHMINQCIQFSNSEPQQDRMMYWMDCLKSLYITDSAEEYLFRENDLHVLGDIIIRVVENLNDGKMLLKPLQCYLVLTCCKSFYENGQFYRASDLKEYLSTINAQNYGIVDLVSEINAL